MNYKLKSLVPSVLALLLLTGCGGTGIYSNYREVEDLQLVRTVCVDASGCGVNVLVCASPTGDKMKLRMFERQGPGIGVTLGELSNTSTGDTAILSHTENLLIGEEQARRGVSDALDYVLRYGEIRLDTSFFIVRGSEGRELMLGIAGEDTSPASVLAGLTGSLPEKGEGCVFTCRDAALELSNGGAALVMAIRGVEEEKLFEGRGDLRAAPAGFALIVDGRLRDFLTEEETLGALLIRSRFKSKNVEVTAGGRRLTLFVTKASVELTPDIQNGRLAGVSADIKAGASLIGAESGVRIEDGDLRRQAERELSELLKRDVTAALIRSRAEGADFLGLFSVARRASPTTFHGVSTGEFREMLRDMEIRVTAESTLLRTYDVTDSLGESGRSDSDGKA